MFIPLFKELKHGKFLLTHRKEYGVCGYQYGFLDNRSTWIIPHNIKSKFFLIEVIINDEVVKHYDLTIIDENTIKLEFSTPINGYVNLLVYNKNDSCPLPFAITLTPTPTPTPTPTLPLLVILNQSPPPAIVGENYSYQFTASGGLPPYRWILAGALPDGLTFNDILGTLVGIPEEIGEFMIRPSVVDSRPVTVMGLPKNLIVYDPTPTPTPSITPTNV